MVKDLARIYELMDDYFWEDGHKREPGVPLRSCPPDSVLGRLVNDPLSLSQELSGRIFDHAEQCTKCMLKIGQIGGF